MRAIRFNTSPTLGRSGRRFCRRTSLRKRSGPTKNNLASPGFFRMTTCLSRLVLKLVKRFLKKKKFGTPLRPLTTKETCSFSAKLAIALRYARLATDSYCRKNISNLLIAFTCVKTARRVGALRRNTDGSILGSYCCARQQRSKTTRQKRSNLAGLRDLSDKSDLWTSSRFTESSLSRVVRALRCEPSAHNACRSWRRWFLPAARRRALPCLR